MNSENVKRLGLAGSPPAKASAIFVAPQVFFGGVIELS
jgi:hypothetical protein